MHCSLALIWRDSDDQRQVALELPEATFAMQLLDSCSLAINRPTLWGRIKQIFKPIRYDLVLQQAINSVVQSFKDRSQAAHYEDGMPRPAARKKFETSGRI